MVGSRIQELADQLTRRAQRQGSVTPQEMDEELSLAGLGEVERKQVLKLARSCLCHRSGRFYYKPPVSERVRQEKMLQREIQKAVQRLVQQYWAAQDKPERRRLDRVSFIQPVQVETETQETLTLLSRDISPTGIRLISSRSFLGQRLQVQIPGHDLKVPWTFLVRILWTCVVGDGLYENGGTFLELASSSETGKT